MSEIKLNQIDVQKLNLQPGEVLIVTVRSDQADEHSVNSLSQGLKGIFPQNKVVVFAVGSQDGIDLTRVKAMSQDIEEQPAEDVARQAAMGCGATPSAYCGDCSCGKKEAWERNQK